MKRFLAFVLAAVLVLGPVTARAEGDENEGIELHTAPAAITLPFTDVAEEDWFHDNVVSCYEEKIMVGTEPTLFSPYAILREEETATLAARLLARQRGETVPAQQEGEAWYGPVIRYLADLHLDITPGVQCTRSRFLTMLGAVLDDAALEPIHTVDSLPDTDSEVVLRFYRAGILNGMDAYGTFAPSRILTRAEAATMVSRVLVPELRMEVAPADYSPFKAAYMEPGTVVFEGGITAEAFLKWVNVYIANWEASALRSGHEFNWNYAESNGKTTLENVRSTVLEALEVTESMGTKAYRDFDYQVYYSRLIDLTGKTLAPDYAVGTGS